MTWFKKMDEAAKAANPKLGFIAWVLTLLVLAVGIARIEAAYPGLFASGMGAVAGGGASPASYD